MAEASADRHPDGQTYAFGTGGYNRGVPGEGGVGGD